MGTKEGPARARRERALPTVQRSKGQSGLAMIFRFVTPKTNSLISV